MNHENIYSNMCLSLQTGCTNESLLLLWQHECNWIYRHRMISEIDVQRYDDAFARAVRKDFQNNEMVTIVTIVTHLFP